MKPHFKQGEPVVRGQAAVIHSAVELSFRSSEQLSLFVKALLADEKYPHFTVETVVGDSLTPDIFKVTIHDIAWAHNLTRIGKIAERIDYNGGG